MVSVRVGSLFLSASAEGTSEPELGGGGCTSYNGLYEEENIHINKKKNSKEKSDLRLPDISDGQAVLLQGI